MKRAVFSGIFLSSVFVVSAVAHVPAQFIVQYAPLPNSLSIAGVKGTLWRGSIEQVFWQGKNYGALNWQLNPSKLLSATAEAQVRFGRGSDFSLQGRGIVGYQMSGLYVENLVASMPVEEIRQLAPPLPVPLELTGQVEISLRSYQYEQPYCSSAQGSLAWNTDTVGTPVADLHLGPVIAQFTCQQSHFDVQGEQQSLQVESGFRAQIDSNLSYEVNAWFKPLADFPPALQQQLKWLPEAADNDGKYQFAHQGRW